MGFWVFLGVYGCLWVSMGAHGLLDVYGYLWVSQVSLGIYGYLWVPMHTYMSFWLSVDVYGFLCVCMGICGCLWVSGCLWVFMDDYGCLWVPMGVYRFLGVYGYYIWKLKMLSIFSFKNPRRFENSIKCLKSHMWYKKKKKKNVCTTGERDFIDSCVFSTRQ